MEPVILEDISKDLKKLEKSISSSFKSMAEKLKEKIYQISFNSDDYTYDELLKILEYAEFIKSQRKN